MGHRYDYVIDIHGDDAPARVVRMVGEKKRVLEIGAGPGSIARVLRDAFDCRVAAVEIDETSVPTLADSCERVYRLNLNDPDWARSLENEGEFDVVVAADVLEHLYDPWSTLQNAKRLIGADGCIVASIPHAGHNGIVASLLDENLEYRGSGLLDRTHIRFFGIKNIQELFDNAGLAIIEAQFVIRLPENTELADAWDRLPATTRAALLKNKFGLVYQAVIKATPRKPGVEALSLLDLPVEKIHGVVESNDKGFPDKSAGSQALPSDRENKDNVALIAFFLTQFHPTPENNRWWGKGFTEWTNVTKAEPLFDGHYQPHLPADLGFYDLRLRSVRHDQIALAKEYGIDGFCYYYYWFSGTRILNQPLDDMLADPESDMPFCLCWANENWTRRWDGTDREILIAQQHLPTDDLDFIKSLIPFFKDPRYIRLDGAPLLIVYQPQRLPAPWKAVKTWREYCEKAGIGPIHICAALTGDNEDYEQFGCDSGLQFPPHNSKCGNVNDSIDFYTPFHGRAVEYSEFAESYLDRTNPRSRIFKTVSPCWDQTARVGSRAFLALNSTPANYEYWLAESIRRTRSEFPDQQSFVFINAWNEWAEGCHLEPDRRYGRQFLEATLRARTGRSDKAGFDESGATKPAIPRAGVLARLDALAAELSIEKKRVDTAEQLLSVERDRLSATYRDLANKRERISALEQELSNERQDKAGKCLE